jgi:hypothetical protein
MQIDNLNINSKLPTMPTKDKLSSQDKHEIAKVEETIDKPILKTKLKIGDYYNIISPFFMNYINPVSTVNGNLTALIISSAIIVLVIIVSLFL